MARDRQRAKRRQAERREARLRQQGRPADGAGSRSTDGDTAARDERPPAPDGASPTGAGTQPDPAAEAQLAAAAPPEDTGRSDTVAESPPPPPLLEADAEGDGDEDAGRARAAGAAAPDRQDRGKVAAFLVAVWAELQRVQWPNRRTLTTLTGVVLGFVLLAGGYLGLLDAIFSRVIEAII